MNDSELVWLIMSVCLRYMKCQRITSRIHSLIDLVVVDIFQSGPKVVDQQTDRHCLQLQHVQLKSVVGGRLVGSPGGA